MYPDHRRPTGTLLQQTQTMLSTGSNPTLIANFLHSQQLPVKPRDIYNIKQQLHPSSTPESELQEVLHQPGISSYFSHDENHVLNCISFCTSDQKQRFNSAMSRCTTIASILADLPVAEFQEAIKWLDAVELQVN